MRTKLRLINIPISKIIYEADDCPFINELSKSIQEHGLINPIIVERRNLGYRLISGKRRVEACKRSGLSEISALCNTYSNFEANGIPYIETFHKINHSFLKNAEYIKTLAEEWNMNSTEISSYLSISLEETKNFLKLSTISENQREIINTCNISLNQALMSLKIVDYPLREKFLNYIHKENLNDKEAKELLERILGDPKRKTIKSSLPKDVRLYLNNIVNTVNAMRESDFDVSFDKNETSEYIECIVKVKKSV